LQALDFTLTLTSPIKGEEFISFSFDLTPFFTPSPYTEWGLGGEVIITYS